MSLSAIKQRSLLVLLAGYLLFDYGFMQLRVPPFGFGVPLGEIFLIFALLTTDVPLALTRLSRIVYLLPFLAWWAYGLGRAIADSTTHGLWALRDATPVIESLYLIVGFAVFAGTRGVERVARWLPLALTAACVYGLGYTIQPQIQAMSPNMVGADHEPVPLFGDYAITGTVMLWSAFYCLIASEKNRVMRRLGVPVAGLLIAFVIALMQARTTYLQLLGIGVILLMFRRPALGKLVATMPVLLLVLAVITILDLHIAGRLSDKISLSFFVEHIETIFGGGTNDPGSLALAAQGVDMRIGWWENIYQRLTADPTTLLTGLGYGVPLTNFRDQLGDIVREPHNSYISVVARLGVLGFLAWAMMQIELFKGWLRAYRGCRRAHWQEGETLLLMILAFAVLVLVDALGEDALEKPYHAIPLYTLLGVALRIAYVLSCQPSATAPLPWPRQRFIRTARPRAAD